MENRQLLTIAIPTYNREKELKACLDAFCPQLTEEVKLIVRNNCSSNYNFKGFIAPYVKRYSIEVVENPVNIGGDANIARMFETCDTEWLWVCGDDDTPSKQAVNAVLKTIKEHHDCVFIKFGSKKDIKTQGLEQLLDVFKIRGEFGNSFFISNCIHHLSISREMMFWHYTFLSTKIAQILRVLKYIEINPEGKCFFCSMDILVNHGAASWNVGDMAIEQLTVFDYFKNEKKLFTDSVFKDIIRYIFIFTDQSDFSWSEKIKTYRIYLIKYGFLPFLRNNALYLLNYQIRRRLRSLMRR